MKKFLISLALLFLPLQVFSASISTLTDNFNDNSLDAKWTVNGTASEVNGQIEIPTGAWAALYSAAYYDLTGSSASVKIIDAGNLAIADYYFVWRLQIDSNNNLSWYFNNGYIYASYIETGNYNTVYSAVYDADTYRYLRIREASGTIYWDSSDGITWTNRGSVATPIIITALQTIWYIDGAVTPVTTTAKVDNFNILPGLIAHYSMDDNAANTIVVDSINGNNGVSLNNTSSMTTSGRIGNALNFNGTTDTINCDNPGIFEFGTDSFSYGLWVYVTESAGAYDMPIYKGGASNNNPGFDIELGSGGWVASLSDGVISKVITFLDEVYSLNNWVFLCVVVDRTTNEIRTYQNSIRIDSEDITGWGSVTNTGENLYIGQDYYLFKGKIDDIRIYNYALTQTEINNLYALGVTEIYMTDRSIGRGIMRGVR